MTTPTLRPAPAVTVNGHRTSPGAVLVILAPGADKTHIALAEQFVRSLTNRLPYHHTWKDGATVVGATSTPVPGPHEHSETGPRGCPRCDLARSFPTTEAERVEEQIQAEGNPHTLPRRVRGRYPTIPTRKAAQS
jgi:hypothetical protein